jgi:hypothetical protein
MLIFGHTYLKSERFYHIHDVDSILQTPSNSLLFIEFDEQNLDVIEYMKDNGLSYALEVKTLKEAIFAEYLNAKYLICTKEIVKSIQDRAEHYLFDAKVLCRIEEDYEIEALAISGVDGVIFSDAVIKI